MDVAGENGEPVITVGSAGRSMQRPRPPAQAKQQQQQQQQQKEEGREKKEQKTAAHTNDSLEPNRTASLDQVRIVTRSIGNLLAKTKRSKKKNKSVESLAATLAAKCPTTTASQATLFN